VDHLKTWLEHDLIPRTFYELLGMPCLSDQRDALLSNIKSATRFLHQYQHHNDKQMVERARRLQLMCARAAYTFSDDAAWQAYDADVLKMIRDECLVVYPIDSLQRRSADVRIWLRDIQRIAENRIDEVLNSVTRTNTATEAKTESRGNPSVDSSSTMIPVARKPAPPPIPLRIPTGKVSTAPPVIGLPEQMSRDTNQNQTSPRSEILTEPSEVIGQSNDSDRRIWRLTGIILLLTLLGALWLAFKNLELRH